MAIVIFIGNTISYYTECDLVASVTLPRIEQGHMVYVHVYGIMVLVRSFR